MNFFIRQYLKASAHTFLSSKHKASFLTIEEDSESLEKATRAFQGHSKGTKSAPHYCLYSGLDFGPKADRTAVTA